MRFASLALAALLGARAAAGSEPVLDASAYVDALNEVGDETAERMEAADRELAELPPIARFESFRLEGLAALRDGRERIERIAERPGDQGLRASTLAYLALGEQLFSEALPEAFELLSKERVKNADLARLEAVMAHIEDAPREGHARVTAAYRAYAKANGWRFRESAPDEDEPDEPPFTAPGIPPAGSRLGGDVHVGFAIRYRNEALDLHNMLTSSANRLVQAMNADGASIEAARKQELEQVRSVRALAEGLEPWQGDATLRDGLVACARGLERALTKPVRAFGKAVAKGFSSQKQVDAANALIAEINQAVDAAMKRSEEAEARFRARWAFDAYDAWSEARAEHKRERGAPRPKREGGEPREERQRPAPSGPPA
jgi:hypothetical protein